MPALDGLASPEQIVWRAQQAWRPPARLRLSEWADQHFYLSAESSADPGPWHTLPYQREPMDCMTDPRVVSIAIMKSARIGYTKMLGAGIGYYIHHDPCALLLIQPTLTDAKGYSKEEIAPMLRDCAVLAEKFPPEVERANTLLHKRFAGGILQIVGARSAASFRRVSRRVIFGDEVDAYPPSAGQEGDPITLATKRSEYFWNRKLVWGSTPTLAGASRIELLFASGDQRRYHVACPHCDAAAPFVFQSSAGDQVIEAPVRGHVMRWPAGRPAEACFVCVTCGSEIEERHKRTMIAEADRRQRDGESGIGWVAHTPFRGHASFHIWSAYSYSPNATWASIAQDAESAARHPDTYKTFVNTSLGETWKEAADAPEWERLYGRRDTYPIGACPAGVLLLTCGVDVQKDHLVYEVVGWGRGKRSWSIDQGVLPCDTADADAMKAQVDALVDRTFPGAGGRRLSIRLLALDSGYQTQTVYAVARQYPLSRVIAVKGTDRAGVLVGMPSKVDVTVAGSKAGYRVWPVAGAVAKSELYGWLKLRPPTDEARAAGAVDPPGYCRWPEYGETYFKQLVAEQLVAQRTAQGFLVYLWTLPPGRENHALDARVYARCAAAVAGLDRFAESAWNRLENEAGVASTPTPDPPVEARQAESVPARAEAATQAVSPPWIRPRTGWLAPRGRR